MLLGPDFTLFEPFGENSIGALSPAGVSTWPPSRRPGSDDPGLGWCGSARAALGVTMRNLWALSQGAPRPGAGRSDLRPDPHPNPLTAGLRTTREDPSPFLYPRVNSPVRALSGTEHRAPRTRLGPTGPTQAPRQGHGSCPAERGGVGRPRCQMASRHVDLDRFGPAILCDTSFGPHLVRSGFQRRCVQFGREPALI